MKKVRELLKDTIWRFRNKFHFVFEKINNSLQKASLRRVTRMPRWLKYVLYFPILLFSIPISFIKDIIRKTKKGEGVPNRINSNVESIDVFFEKSSFGFITRWPGWLKAIFYLAPALTLLSIFTFFPIFNSFLISFYTGYNIQTSEFDGYTLIGNYVTVLKHAAFLKSIVNTGIIVFVSVPITIILSLLIAVAMNAIKPLKGFYQTIFFLPYVTNSIAIGLVFAYIFSGNTRTINNPALLGLANQVIKAFGGTPVVFIENGGTFWSAMLVILVYGIWSGLAFKIIVFMAGLQGIDKQYYQAAQIDGANRSTSFKRITVPLISPMIFYILITSVIGVFKIYSTIVAIIGPTGRFQGANGPVDMRSIVFYIYSYIGAQALNGQLSLAAAASIILFAIILVFTIVQLQVGKRRVHY
jgi:multiple sugar transport system permease protein